MPASRQEGGFGDLLLRLKVTVPDNLSPEEETLVKQWRELRKRK
ncbi:hypothetical protein [Marinilabilia salmonicolor]|nr:hypothetical protein [Marinilabilia salmonicolor]